MKRATHKHTKENPGEGESRRELRGSTPSDRARDAKDLSAAAHQDSQQPPPARTDGGALSKIIPPKGIHGSGEGLAAAVADNAPRSLRSRVEQKRTESEARQLATKILDACGPIQFRTYQSSIFRDRTSGILILHWSRQIGKSYTLAAWAVDRLLTQLQHNTQWLVTVLSNSRDNGAEFVIKCQEVCRRLGMILAADKVQTIGDAAVVVTDDQSPDIRYENMRMEVRVTMVVDGVERTGRIKVLAANPRTARGFSGDLILDEFAFHEDSNAIWEAAEPILSANPEFLCRIASTGNGKHNMFYRMSAGEGPRDGSVFKSAAGFFVSRVARSEAWKQGVKVYDPNTRQSITPDEARRKSLDKRAYDQNYECLFNDENMALLTAALIQQAEREGIPIDEQAWSPVSMARMWRAKNPLFAGQDVGRNRDLSVIAVMEKEGQTLRVIAMLRMAGMRLPDQQKQLDLLMTLPQFRCITIDMTGLGIGLVEYAQEKWGTHRVRGVNFATTEPINEYIRSEGRKAEKAKVTEIMATELLGTFEDRRIELHVQLDADALDDLRKPERITSPGGKVSIAAVRDEAGHADHFWAIALAIRSTGTNAGPFVAARVPASRRSEQRSHRKGCIG